MVAGAETHNRQEGEAPVLRSFTHTDTESRFQSLPQVVPAHDPTTNAVADKGDMASHWFAEDQIVKRRHTVKFIRRHLEERGHIFEALVRYPASVLLNDLQRFDGRRPLVGIVGELLLDF